MARLTNTRDSDMTRWVIPAASRIRIQSACKEVQTQLFAKVALIEMAQSPKTESRNEKGEGVLNE